MGKEHRLAERRQGIINALSQTGQLSVVELSSRFDVSEVTIRQDLQSLADQGLLLRTRGGALSVNATPEYTYDVRQQQKSTEKARIGQAAANLIQYGDTIFLDASTTTHAIVPYLKQIPELTVITNSLKIAISLLDMPQINVLLPGGHLRRTSISLIGQPQFTVIDNINIQVGFFGARGLAIPEGLTDVDLAEVQMKRTMVENCRRVVGVLDSGKWGKVAAATFAHINEINVIISDTGAPTSIVEEIRRQQVEVILV